jgi:hypothetical protein
MHDGAQIECVGGGVLDGVEGGLGEAQLREAIEVEWAGEDVWFIYTGADGVQNRVRLTPVAD